MNQRRIARYRACILGTRDILMIDVLLADLEARIDPVGERRLLEQWIEWCDGRFTGYAFHPMRGYVAPARVDWPSATVNEALEDQEAMAIQQFAGVSGPIAGGVGAVPCVRANYGSSILPSLWGVEQFVMDAALNTLPTSLPIPGGIDGIKAALDKGMPDLRSGLGAKTFEMGQRFIEMMKPYPKVSEFVHIYHPDVQGPIDACELLCGSQMFYYLYDYPELMKQFLDLITQTYIAFMREWAKIVPPKLDGYAAHWSMLHKGRIALRNDSLMNLSEEMYVEFVRPFDQRILDEFGGGMVHFCGRGDHFIRAMSEMRGYYAGNSSQPELNDMETIFANTVDKGINLIGLSGQWLGENMRSGRDLHGLVHVM